ncbi:uncharacterized protein PV09_04439 [Verruconis gallopava]|uniref:Zn(2)-C6 fungal-type domain-containing protein n=1 Tax=Verruconis gallopava TaxID=253628 RepID=A0A0D1XQ47_9PEZI|nr:uncharacterized protein PV09_04439 [Verruconis gallopava]KIW04706.1 hypothetical protein PV09_04439 [Verruconis gallopava]
MSSRLTAGVTDNSARDDGPASISTQLRQTNRPKRKQVSRACNWCRLHRAKCDPYVPCRNCQERGERCSKKNNAELQSLPRALREIERLSQQIKELESSSENLRNAREGSPRGSESSVACEASTAQQTSASATKNHVSGYEGLLRTLPRKRWEGLSARGPQSQQVLYYGPSSTFYFLSRINAYIGSEFQQPHSNRLPLPHSASKELSSPDSTNEATRKHGASAYRSDTGEINLPRRQEEYLLGLFWQFHYCTLPIIDDEDFMTHYKSLWASHEASTRKPSALVDIVLALSMQYGSALLPSDRDERNSGIYQTDSTIAGRWLYRRSRALLASDLENPSITTLQCHIYSASYLSSASFANMAHNTLAVAVRIAQSLALHLNPPAYLPEREKQLRRRIWWVLSTLESKTSLKLGRPFAFQISDVSCPLPDDDQETALAASSAFGIYAEDVTWLTYSVQCQKLILVSRDIYEFVYDGYAKILDSRAVETPYQDHRALESCAQLLSSQMSRFERWLNNVPKGIKNKRRDGGRSMSTDRTALEVEQQAPLWLQRQRICLELVYHTMAMNFYRPFITFSSNDRMSTPTAELHAYSCINHAVALTNIIYQVLSETDLLNGWHESFQWQWNATVTTLGFLFAYPISQSSAIARRSIDKAIKAFELFGSNNVAVSLSAANVTRDLVEKSDVLASRFRAGFGTSHDEQGLGTGYAFRRELDQSGYMQSSEGGLSTMILDGANNFSNFMDLALSVDVPNTFEDLFTDTSGMFDPWKIAAPEAM